MRAAYKITHPKLKAVTVRWLQNITRDFVIRFYLILVNFVGNKHTSVMPVILFVLYRIRGVFSYHGFVDYQNI